MGAVVEFNFKGRGYCFRFGLLILLLKKINSVSELGYLYVVIRFCCCVLVMIYYRLLLFDVYYF